MNDNVTVIDLKGNKNKGGLDLGFLSDTIDSLEAQAELLRETMRVTKDAAESAVRSAGLENISFSIANQNAFTEHIMTRSNILHNVILSGEDDKYRYYLLINMVYSPDDEFNLDDDDDNTVSVDGCFVMPESASTSVLRLERGSFTEFASYRFDQHQWVEIDVQKVFGFTENQLKMLNDENESGAKMLLMVLYNNAVGKLSDEEFEAFYNEHKPLLDLYEKVRDYLDMHVLTDKTVCLSPAVDCTGTAVVYKDGKFKVKGCVIGNMLYTAYETKDEDKIIKFIEFMYDRKEFDMISFPLSGTAFAVVEEDLDYSYYMYSKRKNEELTKTEERNFDLFIDAFNELMDSLAEDDDDDEE